MENLELEKIASQVRRDILRMVSEVNSGHPGGSLGCADFLTLLYFEVMNYNPKDFTMDGKNEDLFFLSNGHISPVWYSVLARAGYFPVADLGTFRKLSSKLQGHPSTDKKLPGIRMASGSLGQGLSVAIGAALTKKLNGDKSFVYCLHGDGETVLSLGNLGQKWQAFGWEVLEMNGHDMQDMKNTIAKAHSLCGNGKPVVIIMKTEMGQGVDFMMGSHKWHGVAPNPEQLVNALGKLEETLGDY